MKFDEARATMVSPATPSAAREPRGSTARGVRGRRSNPAHRLLAAGLAGCLWAAGCATAWAHDTWFQRRAESTPQRPVLVLGTGDLFPTFDSRNAIEHLVRSGCRAGGQARGPLAVADPTVEALWVTPPEPLPPAARISCWAQLQPFEVDLADDIVEAYFKEAMPPASVRQAWAAQKAKGQPWRERYIKHARSEWFPDPLAAESLPPEPTGMGMDALLLMPLKAPRVGDELEFQVLKDGQPLPNFSVEFRQHASRFGLWRRTDEQGRVKLRAPTAGRWLLRGIELTPPPAQASEPLWLGLFITLAFEVLPPARP